ncbi:MAG: hypothetical protein QOJ39_988, partial [Candidatus Eremiobacteraeota bacterium]|nr:hypothetical protein [Candidatus Eremiobacteraeota bacterium]
MRFMNDCLSSFADPDAAILTLRSLPISKRHITAHEFRESLDESQRHLRNCASAADPREARSRLVLYGSYRS